MCIRDSHTAIINPSTMEVEKDVLSPIECEMAGSAYGELMQNCVMYDEADNLYLACFHEDVYKRQPFCKPNSLQRLMGRPSDSCAETFSSRLTR